MRAPSSLLIPILTIMACEPMDDPGSPWQPVPVSAQAPAGQPAVGSGPDPSATEVPAVDPMFDVPEPIVIHSSELGQESQDVVATEPEAAEPEPEVPEAEVAVAEPVAPLAAEPSYAAFARFGTTAVGGWPLRLVATVPGAQPPRAILGLPGGDEVVVTPGAMLPEAGVVVMAIGAESIELAEVRPAGDHATVQGRTLQAQRTQRIEIGAAQ
jgi:hypothetical protein